MPENVYRVIIEPEAAEGMENAYRWIEADSQERADQWLNGLMRAVDSLTVFPSRCSLAPENESFGEEIRQLIYGSGETSIASS